MKRRILIVALLSVFVLSGLYMQGGPLKKKKKVLPHITQNEPFLAFCKKAIADPKVFRRFKRDPIYNLFYENVSFEEGNALLHWIQERMPEVLEENKLEKVRELDYLGNPHVYVFEPIGPFSASTLQYLKIAGELQSHFGDLKKVRIVEIGGGCGGLCKILCDLFDVEQYSIIDFPESLELCKKHLQALGMEGVQFIPLDEVKSQRCDLLISQYHFSGANGLIQKKLMKKLFPRASYGYLVCNFYPRHFRIRPLAKEQLFKKIKRLHQNVEILPEEPQTGKENCVVLWAKDYPFKEGH